MNNELLQALFKRFKYGEREIFDKIYDETNKFIYFYALSIVHNQEMAKDIMQNTYITIMQKISQYVDNTNPNAWIATIVRNLCMDELDKNKRLQYMDLEKNEHLFKEEVNYEIDNPILNVAKECLSKEDYQVIVLVVILEYTRKEVGIILNKPTSSITFKYLNALRILKKKLKEGGMYDEKFKTETIDKEK